MDGLPGLSIQAREIEPAEAADGDVVHSGEALGIQLTNDLLAIRQFKLKRLIRDGFAIFANQLDFDPMRDGLGRCGPAVSPERGRLGHVVGTVG